MRPVIERRRHECDATTNFSVKARQDDIITPWSHILRKIKYYLDTTIFNFVFAERDAVKRDITIKLFKDLAVIAEEVYVSDEVIREISRAPEPRKSQLENLVRETGPYLLEIDIEALELADRYVAEGIIPERYPGDALHIATAVTNGIEAIVSWNFEHIVKLKTRIMVNGINKLLGYHEIEICSPEEVIEI